MHTGTPWQPRYRRTWIAALFALSVSSAALAQSDLPGQGATLEPRVLLIVDTSSSMILDPPGTSAYPDQEYNPNNFGGTWDAGCSSRLCIAKRVLSQVLPQYQPLVAMGASGYYQFVTNEPLNKTFKYQCNYDIMAAKNLDDTVWWATDYTTTRAACQPLVACDYTKQPNYNCTRNNVNVLTAGGDVDPWHYEWGVPRDDSKSSRFGTATVNTSDVWTPAANHNNSTAGAWDAVFWNPINPATITHPAAPAWTFDHWGSLDQNAMGPGGAGTEYDMTISGNTLAQCPGSGAGYFDWDGAAALAGGGAWGTGGAPNSCRGVLDGINYNCRMNLTRFVDQSYTNRVQYYRATTLPPAGYVADVPPTFIETGVEYYADITPDTSVCPATIASTTSGGPADTASTDYNKKRMSNNSTNSNWSTSSNMPAGYTACSATNPCDMVSQGAGTVVTPTAKTYGSWRSQSAAIVAPYTNEDHLTDVTAGIINSGQLNGFTTVGQVDTTVTTASYGGAFAAYTYCTAAKPCTVTLLTDTMVGELHSYTYRLEKYRQWYIRPPYRHCTYLRTRYMYHQDVTVGTCYYQRNLWRYFHTGYRYHWVTQGGELIGQKSIKPAGETWYDTLDATHRYCTTGLTSYADPVASKCPENITGTGNCAANTVCRLKFRRQVESPISGEPGRLYSVLAAKQNETSGPVSGCMAGDRDPADYGGTAIPGWPAVARPGDPWAYHTYATSATMPGWCQQLAETSSDPQPYVRAGYWAPTGNIYYPGLDPQTEFIPGKLTKAVSGLGVLTKYMEPGSPWTALAAAQLGTVTIPAAAPPAEPVGFKSALGFAPVRSGTTAVATSDPLVANQNALILRMLQKWRCADPNNFYKNTPTALCNTAAENQFGLRIQDPPSQSWLADGDPTNDAVQDSTEDYTPLYGSLRGAASYLGQLIDADVDYTCRPYYVILMTDGDENNAFARSGFAPTVDDEKAAVAGAPGVIGLGNLVTPGGRTKEVKTIVIGFGALGTSGTDRLNEMAKVGKMALDPISGKIGNFPLTGQALSAASEAQLKASFTEAFDAIVAGQFSRSKPVLTSARDVAYVGYMTKISNHPEWRGYLDSYNMTTSPPSIRWAADVHLDAMASASRVIKGQVDGGFVDFTVANEGRWRTAFSTSTTSAQSQAIINFMRNDTLTQTFTTGQTRVSRLADIFHSTPLARGGSAVPDEWASPAGIERANFIAFRDGGLDTREPTVFAGTNGGMLHAFREQYGATPSWAGDERWAMVPKPILSSIAGVNTGHVWGVDGQFGGGSLNIGTTAAPIWKQYLFMGFREGASSVQAYDITSTGVPANNAAVWEFKHPGLGKTYGNIGFGRTLSGPSGGSDRWTLLVPGGYTTGADAGNGLFVVDAKLGTTFGQSSPAPSVEGVDAGMWKIQYVASPKNNLPTAPAILRADKTHSNGSAMLKYAYISDTNGNMSRMAFSYEVSGVDTPITDMNKWKPVKFFDPTDTNCRLDVSGAVTQVVDATTGLPTGVSLPLPLASKQPSWLTPLATSDESRVKTIYMGTGDALNPTAVTGKKNYFFAIRDTNDNALNAAGAVCSGKPLWVKSFDIDEKVVSQPTYVSKTMFLATYRPAAAGSGCEVAGDAVFYAFDRFTGAPIAALTDASGNSVSKSVIPGAGIPSDLLVTYSGGQFNLIYTTSKGLRDASGNIQKGTGGSLGSSKIDPGALQFQMRGWKRVR